MGVISNMDESGETVLKHLGIREYFDFVMKSVTTGIEKPDVRAFEMALAAVNVPAYDALHIGDSERCDYLPAKMAGVSERQSLDDLLQLDDSEAIQTQLPPALLPQTSKALVGQTEAAVTQEADEFGEFLQNSEQPAGIPESSVSTKNALGLTLDKAVSSLTLFPPPPRTPQPSSTPDFKETTIAAAVQTPTTIEVPRDPMDVAADQVLGWISTTPKDDINEESNVVSEELIQNAWDSAAGLMGGTNVGTHIGEIASRLCSVIPADSALSNGLDCQEDASDIDNGVLDLEETDAWKSLLLDAGGAEHSFANLESPHLENRIADTIWPCEDNVWSAASEIGSETEEDLVQAYLRLTADTTKPGDSATETNVDNV
ncbi:Haloacid dehalogenase-like hydrolase domain-containing protein 3 [Coemansia interrupta]|uniref:Haloacid dehalogenase-like hydrolase domain-containing protein 3 n=1 Tax=Coemansia interrupta TaxID=1126814 RepID=A0A9W8HNL4_9FUNG|nr:Haloacid dehalogenase-like hydrolase domain-containing protein 3 [Coemansia interrupta]